MGLNVFKYERERKECLNAFFFNLIFFEIFDIIIIENKKEKKYETRTSNIPQF